MKLFDIINKPLGLILEYIAKVFNGNFAVAVFFFTLIVNIVMIPLSIKSQKSSVQQMRIKPKLDALKKRYGSDQRKYNEAMQKLYQEENVSMSGGCLPMILRLVFMLAIYNVIMQPLTYLMHIDSGTIKSATEAINAAKGSRITELSVIEAVTAGKISFPKIAAELSKIDFNFLGIDLTGKPDFSWDIIGGFRKIWIMPIIAFLAQILSSILSMIIQKKTNPDAPTMAGMLLTMPLISLFIGFTLPGGVTFYWACSSLIGGLIQSGVQIFYGPHRMLAAERVKQLAKVCDFEEGQIKKSAENTSRQN